MLEKRNLKMENADKIRCANYLLQMIEKYGAEIMEEKQKGDEETIIKTE